MKSKNPKPKSVSEFQNYIKDLFGNANTSHSFEYIYSYLTRNSSYLSRSILRSGENIDFFIKSFSWLFALSDKLNIDLEAALRKKFPDVCPYCISTPCVCAETGKKPPHYKAEWVIKTELNDKYFSLINANSTKTLSLDNAVIGINTLYPANRSIWAAYGSTYHFSRLFEEIGEIHEGYGAFATKERSIDNLRDELADVFAWLLSAWGIAHKQLPLSDAFIKYYYDGCPVCNSNPCKCKDYSSRAQALVKIEDLDEFKKLISDALALAPQKAVPLQEILASLEEVKGTKSTTDAKRIVAQGLDVLKQAESATNLTATTATNLKNLLDTAAVIAKTFPWF